MCKVKKMYPLWGLLLSFPLWTKERQDACVISLALQVRWAARRERQTATQMPGSWALCRDLLAAAGGDAGSAEGDLPERGRAGRNGGMSNGIFVL